MKKILEKYKYGIVILIATMVLSIPLLWKNLDVYFDDGVQHICRAYSTYLSMKAGESTQVLSNLANGYGYSWNMFYGAFSTVFIILCKFIVGNFVNAYKLTLFLGLLFSGFTMYKLVQKLTGNKITGTLAGVLYISMPYHLTDMYIRNALGEFLSYMFIPLVFLGMYNLFHKEKASYLITIGAVGLIITHNLMSIITAILAFCYLCANLVELKDKEVLKKLGLNVLFIVGLSAFYILPLFQTITASEYAVYQSGMMATKESVANQALKLKELFVTPKKLIRVYELGPHILVMLGFSIAAFRQIEKRYKKEYIFLLFVGILTSLMATNIFPWKIFGEALSIVQFPWRFLTISNFCFAIVCAINMSVVIKKFNFFDILVISTISIVYVCALKSFIPVTENVKKVEEWDIGYMSGEQDQIIVAMGKGEYLPKMVNNNRFYIAAREDTVVVLEGQGVVEDVDKKGSTLTCKVESLETPTIFEFPYVYYPGYEVTVDGSRVNVYESQNGLVAIALSEIPKSDILLEYKGTKAMWIGKLISVISLVAFGVYIFREYRNSNY